MFATRLSNLSKKATEIRVLFFGPSLQALSVIIHSLNGKEITCICKHWSIDLKIFFLLFFFSPNTTCIACCMVKMCQVIIFVEDCLPTFCFDCHWTVKLFRIYKSSAFGHLMLKYFQQLLFYYDFFLLNYYYFVRKVV